jgi:hypothetical protein
MNNYKLKSTKYKSSSVPWSESQASNNLESLDKFLENEKITNSSEPWSKLDKTAKIRKLTTFADTYAVENELSEIEKTLLLAFFKDCLDKKKMQRVKDVIYDKDSGEIKEIPSLFFNKPSNNFTLKNTDKRVSTIKGLTPKKKLKGTFKNNKIVNSESDSDSDSE